MAHESFEDPQVAEILNQHYISIKVDREERPDIDAVYMAVCQGLTGQGGWPLTIVMSPEAKPFFAGTYFPKEQWYQMPGLTDILNTLAKRWSQDKEQVLETAEKIVVTLRDKQQDSVGREESEPLLLLQAKEMYAQNFDEKYGGFGSSPKFPTAHPLMFLLRYGTYEHDDEAVSMVLETLKHMYRGGIFDHIGYGFCRYATDDLWLVPHFEKMLYDNALLTMIYAEAYQLTKDEFYRDVTEKILRYVLREMTDETGGFYSAQDADSEGVEGKYYVFTPQEIIEVLGEERANEFNRFFDIREKPNFEQGNIPNLIENPAFSETKEWDAERQKLYEYRLNRQTLHKDDKILTSWNALMIVALAKAYLATEKEEYRNAAIRCQQFIAEHLTESETGRLMVRYRRGQRAGTGTLDDYAFYVWALTMLYEITAQVTYLEEALDYAKGMETLFWDDKEGGFFLTAHDAEALIYRPKETYDGAMPSGNSVAGYALVKLKKLTGKPDIVALCDQQIAFLRKNAQDYVTGHSFALMALIMNDYERGFLCENGVCS